MAGVGEKFAVGGVEREAHHAALWHVGAGRLLRGGGVVRPDGKIAITAAGFPLREVGESGDLGLVGVGHGSGVAAAAAAPAARAGGGEGGKLGLLGVVEEGGDPGVGGVDRCAGLALGGGEVSGGPGLRVEHGRDLRGLRLGKGERGLERGEVGQRRGGGDLGAAGGGEQTEGAERGAGAREGGAEGRGGDHRHSG